MDRRSLFGGLAAGLTGGAVATVTKNAEGKEMVLVPADTLRKIDEIHAVLCCPQVTDTPYLPDGDYDGFSVLTSMVNAVPQSVTSIISVFDQDAGVWRNIRDEAPVGRKIRSVE